MRSPAQQSLWTDPAEPRPDAGPAATLGKAELATVVCEQARRLAPQVAALRGLGCAGWTAAVMPAAQLVDDASTKVVFRDNAGQPQAILLCSSPLGPTQVAEGVAAAARAKELLRGEARTAILDPLLCGDVQGLSYAVFPWCFALSTHRLGWFLQKRRLRPHLFAWLGRMLRATMQEPSPTEVEELYAGPLDEVARSAELEAPIRAAAEAARRRLGEGSWRPRVVLTHNDLWKGNILLRSPARLFGWGFRPSFVVIDWAGARDRGHPFYDLVRLAQSFGLRGEPLRREVAAHCAALGCDPVDAWGYLLASLGNLGRSLGHLPRERYLDLARRCCQTLFPVVG